MFPLPRLPFGVHLFDPHRSISLFLEVGAWGGLTEKNPHLLHVITWKTPGIYDDSPLNTNKPSGFIPML